MGDIGPQQAHFEVLSERELSRREVSPVRDDAVEISLRGADHEPAEPAEARQA